jgi:hypothetical protein
MSVIGHNGGPALDECDPVAEHRLADEVKYCLRIRRYVSWDPALWSLWNERLELAQAKLNALIIAKSKGGGSHERRS